ncbi:MAG: hypothetical protein ACP5RS_02535 [Thermoplasmata archaeon]
MIDNYLEKNGYNSHSTPIEPSTYIFLYESDVTEYNMINPVDHFQDAYSPVIINVLIALYESCDQEFMNDFIAKLGLNEILELGMILYYIKTKYPTYGTPLLTARYDEDGSFGYFEIILKNCNMKEWKGLYADVFDKLNLFKGKVFPVCLKGLTE